MTTDAAETPEKTRELAYAVDTERMEQNGRAPAAVLAERRCESCKAKLVLEADAGQSVTYKMHARRIREHCASQKGYLTAQMPVMEAAFRIVLASAKQPVPLTQLHQRLQEAWANSSIPRHISEESLARMLAHDDYYGLDEVEEEDAPKATAY